MLVPLTFVLPIPNFPTDIPTLRKWQAVTLASVETDVGISVGKLGTVSTKDHHGFNFLYQEDQGPRPHSLNLIRSVIDSSITDFHDNKQ
jgi:hypothetical protein